jgi:hypothetical protein
MAFAELTPVRRPAFALGFVLPYVLAALTFIGCSRHGRKRIIYPIVPMTIKYVPMKGRPTPKDRLQQRSDASVPIGTLTPKSAFYNR